MNRSLISQWHTCFVVLLLYAALVACNESREKGTAEEKGTSDYKERYLVHLKSAVDSAFADRPLQNGDSVIAYIVIPGTGCPGCISSGESLLLTFLRDKLPVRFLLTSLTSYKILKLKLGDSIVSNRNVFVDQRNAIIGKIEPQKQVYPLIIYNNPRENKLVNYEYMEPGNPEAIQHLYQYIHAKF